MLCLLAGLGLGLEQAVLAQVAPETALAPRGPSLWETDIGAGFQRGAQELGTCAGLGLGMKVLGLTRSHDWGIGTLEYGRMISPVLGKGRWYGGNLELAGELFGAGQFRPDQAYVVGGGPHLRYSFATGHRWVPFLDVGGGATATDIRDHDLSTTFEFNLQGGAGLHFFWRRNAAFTLQYRFIHLSNADMSSPNVGVNSSSVLAGLTWFF
jgi:opacity protein-like surface antigen